MAALILSLYNHTMTIKQYINVSEVVELTGIVPVKKCLVLCPKQTNNTV